MMFASDNWAGAAPEIVDAVARQATTWGTAYGESEIDRAVERRFSEIFEREVAVFLVGTGSAANALALASVNRPGGAVFCHRHSHIMEDECGGVEYLTGGARLVGVAGALGKIDPEKLTAAIAGFRPGFVHAGQAMAISLTQMTEAGTVYSLADIGAIGEIARRHGLPLHMDGARFANALVSLGVSPAEMTWKTGVDILSFGGTKNGCIGAEALIFFDPAKAKDAPYLRKRAGQLFSKSRFIAAQFDAYLRDGLWLKLARHANAMGDRLRGGLSGSARPAWDTHGNEVFAVLPRRDADRLKQAGASFHEWPLPADAGVEIGSDEVLSRLVTSFATRPEEVAAFIGGLSEAAPSGQVGKTKRAYALTGK